MAKPVADLAAIEVEIAHVRLLAPEALRRRWRAEFGRKPPAALGKHLLARMIVTRFQERALGGLDRESLKFLDGLAHRSGTQRRHLKPGTVLVREYQGDRHTVTVERDGLQWQGQIYSSLSAIARAITGTAWSGPRFFALRTADHASDADRRRNGKAAGILKPGRRHPEAVVSGGNGPPSASPLPLQTVFPE